MKQLWRIIPVFLLALSLAAVVGAAPMQSSASQSETKMSRGELVKVDTTAQTFTIKDQSGTETQFHYNSDTKVEGSQTTMQGLASETGNQVTVHYSESGENKIASRIEVSKR